MAVPFILGGAAAVLGVTGAKKALDAHDTVQKANNINQEAQSIVDTTNEKVKNARDAANSKLISLGRKKISIMTNGIRDFVEEFSKIKNVNLRDSVGIDEIRDFDTNGKDFLEMREASVSLGELASGGLGSIGAGALAAAGAYGAVGTFAAASTGTAIAGLSGAAATNATLAWLGGGSLAAGGMGVTGGMAVLGGLVAGPLLFVGGSFYESKANKALNEAKTNRSKAINFQQEGKNICTLLNAISKRSEQIKSLLTDLNGFLVPSIDEMRHIIRDSGTDWQSYTGEEQISIAKSIQIAKTIKLIVDTPILREDGSLDNECERVINLKKEYVRKLAEG